MKSCLLVFRCHSTPHLVGPGVWPARRGIINVVIHLYSISLVFRSERRTVRFLFHDCICFASQECRSKRHRRAWKQPFWQAVGDCTSIDIFAIWASNVFSIGLSVTCPTSPAQRRCTRVTASHPSRYGATDMGCRSETLRSWSTVRLRPKCFTADFKYLAIKYSSLERWLSVGRSSCLSSRLQLAPAASSNDPGLLSSFNPASHAEADTASLTSFLALSIDGSWEVGTVASGFVICETLSGCERVDLFLSFIVCDILEALCDHNLSWWVHLKAWSPMQDHCGLRIMS